MCMRRPSRYKRIKLHRNRSILVVSRTLRSKHIKEHIISVFGACVIVRV